MSRRKNKPTRRVAVPIEKLNAIVERTRTEALPEAEHATLKAAVDTLACLTAELESANTSLARVQRIVFGSSSETTAGVLGEANGATAAGPDPAHQASPPAETEAPPPGKRKGHGRNGAQDYPRAPRIPVPHATLKHGDPCPEPGCDGRLYRQRQEPALLVRVTGVAPLQAQVYELERLRCGLCGTVFTAEPPAGVGSAKYDDSAAAMIALLKYGCGLPFHRIARLEQALAIPLPATTQWDVVQPAAGRLAPAFEELARQAGEGSVLYNDDTPMRILNFTEEARAEALPPGAKAERTGTFTSGVVAETPNGPIALFKTGPCHAGEHLAEVLDKRQDPAVPIQMSDALARNTPGEHPTQAANCIPHYPAFCFIPSQELAVAAWQGGAGDFPPDKTKGSQGVQEREQVRFRLPRSNPCRGDAGAFPERLECLAFHLEVGRDVATGRGHARVSQVITDDGNVVAGLQQGDGTAVAKDMRGDAPPAKGRYILCRHRHVFAQDVGDAVSRERFAATAEENRIARSTSSHAR
jgi:transposase